MGLGMKKCCCQRELLIYENSFYTENESKFNDIELLDQIPSKYNIEESFNYIQSKLFYKFLVKKVPKALLIKKLCLKLNPKELFILIKKIINWICSFDYNNKTKNTYKQNYIENIKSNTLIATKYLLIELENINLAKEIEIYLFESLSDWAMIMQLILFLINNNNFNFNKYIKNSDDNGLNGYSFNIWEGKDVNKIYKRYIFDGCYYLIQIKNNYMKKNNLNFIQLPTDNKITNETKNSVSKLYHLINDFVNELAEI